MQTIFYSWQSDLPNSTNRGFIGDCLEKAIKELRAEGSLGVDPALDRDTQGVPGSPDIADTIFEKIDKCSMFVGDVSLINGQRDGATCGWPVFVASDAGISKQGSHGRRWLDAPDAKSA
ncbi:MAG TPA: hypothetical protein VGI40_09160 [Pirellulaceae bacterium]|jgi:hypothetical protein